MTTRAVDVAVTQLGVAEATGKNDGIPAERYNAGECLPWCAALVLYCNAHSDEVLLAPYKSAAWYELRAVANLESYCRQQGWMVPDGEFIKPGDIVFFANRGTSDPGVGRHVGLVERLSGQPPGPVLLHTIEGNVTDKVSRLEHDLSNKASRERITGYARIPLRLGK